LKYNLSPKSSGIEYIKFEQEKITNLQNKAYELSDEGHDQDAINVYLKASVWQNIIVETVGIAQSRFYLTV